MKRPSMICSQWDVVTVPFPFTDKPDANTYLIMPDPISLFSSQDNSLALRTAFR